jgi:hypothetical protein
MTKRALRFEIKGAYQLRQNIQIVNVHVRRLTIANIRGIHVRGNKVMDSFAITLGTNEKYPL